MIDETQHQAYLMLMANFLNGRLAAETFCDRFIKQWMRDRDAAWEAQQAKKASWSQPYDELLLAAFQRGEISVAEFQREHAKLWGYADDIEFQTMISALHSACSCWRPDPELEWEIGDKQLRQEVGDALSKYRAPQAQTVGASR